MESLSRRTLLTAGLASFAFAVRSPTTVWAAQGKKKKKSDPMIDHLVGRMIDNHNAMKRDGMRARNLYRHADAVRAFSVYGANNTEIDDRVRTSVSNHVQRLGRSGAADAVHRAHGQCLDCRADLTIKGFDINDLRGTLNITPKLQQKGIDVLQDDGLMNLMEREADVLELRAKQVERTFGAGLYNPNAGLIVNAYTTCDDWWSDGCDSSSNGGGGDGSGASNCRQWSAVVNAKDVLTAWACFDPLTVETCPLMIVNLAATKFMAWWAGC